MIDIIIPYKYNNINNDYLLDLKNNIESFNLNKEFKYLIKKHIRDSSFTLDRTLSCLESQRYKNINVIIVTSKPDLIEDYLSDYKLNIKLVKDKYNRFEKNNYSSSKNTGIYFTENEYIVFMDDENIFNRNLLKEYYNLLSKGYQCVGNTVIISKCKDVHKNQDTPFKSFYNINCNGNYNIVSYNDCGRIKNPLFLNGNSHGIDRKTLLDINGFNELYDGARGHEDTDFGMRYHKYCASNNKKYIKYLTYNKIYNIKDVKQTNFIYNNRRNSNMFLKYESINSGPVANNKKKDKKYLDNYAKLDDTCIIKDLEDAPIFNIREQIKNKELDHLLVYEQFKCNNL